MSRLRILLLAPFCDPDAVSMPYVAYCHAAELARLHDVTLVIRAPFEKNVRRGMGPFQGIEVVRMPRLEQFYDWSFRKLFKSNYSSQALTAFGYPIFIEFERRAWWRLRNRIHAGEFDVVLRLLPMSAVLPSPFSFFLRKGPIPMVIGPINGGLPFVKGFSQAENQKELISSLRRLYRYLPFARSTYRYASAIIAASSQTCYEFSKYHEKLFYIPENGIYKIPSSDHSRHSKDQVKLKLLFVGGLVPCKACDLGLRAAAPHLKAGIATFIILGDGPERHRLEALAKSLGIEDYVTFCGWVSHSEVLARLQDADVLVFPSVRDFGAGVVFEALASGAVPVVADFGGPGDIVHSEVGFKVPLTDEITFVSHMEEVLSQLVTNRELLEQLRAQGMRYARERLTWEAKAQDTTKVLNWVLRRGPKPNLPPPKELSAAVELIG